MAGELSLPLLRDWANVLTGRPLRSIVLTALLAPLTPVHGGAPAVSGSVISDGGKGIADAVVFVLTPPTAPARNRSSEVLDQIHKTFVPGLLPIAVGTSVRFPNHDQIHHHVYSFSPAKTFELPLYKGEAVPVVLFDKVGVVKIGCNIHDWMSGIILVLPSPHFSVTDSEGRFVMEGLPAGDYTLVAWHELSKIKPEATAHPVRIAGEVSHVVFTLPLAAARPRPAMHGVRGEP
jgi:plastocyanin